MLDALILDQIQRATPAIVASAPAWITSMPSAASPITVSCFHHEAARQQIEPLKLLAVLKTEGGRLGSFVRNSNGTYDIGPMQINTVHLDDLAKTLSTTKSVVAQKLAYDGCFNVAVGAWMLRLRTNEAGGDFWFGIGRFHSKTPAVRNRYILKVHQNMVGIVNKVNTANAASQGAF
ncbi:lytic transglycosylase domain-containing protein [Hydrogenophaga sp. 2FB]|uniref:lytic transglycosylase domain-containing protein n=1 Tax=Hydrogenophaga sp. 2FB TaxID=2502187 RepID=UPI0010F7D914|nr:lytic transglycosylase domain-containing protein [Hydrogenophaga sp. 2FB]